MTSERRSNDMNMQKPSAQGAVAAADGWKWNFYESFEKAPMLSMIYTIWQLAVLMAMGLVREVLRWSGIEKNRSATETPLNKNFAPLYWDFGNFYTFNLFNRFDDTCNRPICSAPASRFRVLLRSRNKDAWTQRLLGTDTAAINLASYNYLGFGGYYEPCIKQDVGAIGQYGLSCCSPRHAIGSLQLQHQLEQLVAEFVGMEDAVCFQMGFATNSMNIPALLGKGDLIVSDERNHSSLILGCRLSGASIRVFRHNDTTHLEKVVREAIVRGQSNSGRPWRRILILVEGIYSMEGSIVKLPEVIRIKKKYGAYLYVDEAHSIGALGPHGRGVVDYFGCDARDIDILMGTFTKSFASAGGYIAGSKKLIDFLRARSHSVCYGASMSPPIAQQIIAALSILMGRDGSDEGARRIRQLAHNTAYFRRRLHQLGFIVHGNRDSPIMPVLTFYPTQTVFFSRDCLRQGIGLQVVGFPVVPLFEARARICISAGHTKEDLDKALVVLSKLGDRLRLKLSSYRDGELHDGSEWSLGAQEQLQEEQRQRRSRAADAASAQSKLLLKRKTSKPVPLVNLDAVHLPTVSLNTDNRFTDVFG